MDFRYVYGALILLLAAQLAACGGGSNSGGGSTGVNGQVTPNGVTVTWTAPVAREDDSPLSLSEIAGYHVYYGMTEGDYPNRIDIRDGSAVEAVFTDLPPGTYYFVVTTYDSAERESSYSPPVVITL